MDFLQAITTGVIQGLAEFLPISSSGHLVFMAEIFNRFFNLTQVSETEEIFFDLMLHLGTLVAILIYFHKEVKKILENFVYSIKNRDFSTPDERLPWYIIIGTFATLITAFPLRKLLENTVANPAIVGAFLIVTAGLLFFTEFYSKHHSKDDRLTFKKAIFIGIFQGLAFFPGISRSGSTIAAGLFCGMGRVEAARYSFLLSIPIILVAVVIHTSELFMSGALGQFSWCPIFTGTLVAGIVGYFCIKYFLQFIATHSLNYFALYCFIVGVFAIKYFS